MGGGDSVGRNFSQEEHPPSLTRTAPSGPPCVAQGSGGTTGRHTHSPFGPPQLRPRGTHPLGALGGGGQGLVWFGLVWFGLVWFGLVWFGLVWFGLVWFGLVWFGLVWLAHGPWPHRLNVSEGLRHGSAKKLHPQSHLSPPAIPGTWGLPMPRFAHAGFGTLWESNQRTLACSSAVGRG